MSEESQGSKQPELVTEEQRARLRELFRALPDAYPERYARIAALRHAFHAAMGSALEESLNRHLDTLPQQSVEEAKELASWLGAQLRPLQLTPQDAQGRPATLLVDAPSPRRPGAFRYRMLVADGAKRVWKGGPTERPHIRLIENDLRPEPFARGFRPDGRRGGR